MNKITTYKFCREEIENILLKAVGYSQPEVSLDDTRLTIEETGEFTLTIDELILEEPVIEYSYHLKS
jgi:hypothetical protein